MLNGAKQSLIASNHWYSEVVVSNAGSGICSSDKTTNSLIAR